MGMVALTRYETMPGHGQKHLEIHMEALQRLRGLGVRAVALQPLAGADVGSLAMSMNFDSYADYATSIQKVQADSGWQEFFAGATASGAAQQVESSFMNDLDPAYQPDPDRPLGCLLATQWRAVPGRMEEFVGKVAEAATHEDRLGIRSRPMQSIVGAHPLTMLIAVGFADLDAYGAYSDAANADAEWQAFWGAAMADPSAELIRSGVYLNISGD